MPEICLRTQNYGQNKIKLFLDILYPEEGRSVTSAMLEDTDGDGIIDNVNFVGDIDGDADRDEADRQLLLKMGNLFLRVRAAG